jgi:hypothetical protein
VSAGAAGAGALMATCLWMGPVDRDDACVCFESPVAVNEPTGRVFHLGSGARPQALPDASVALRAGPTAGSWAARPRRRAARARTIKA